MFRSCAGDNSSSKITVPILFSSTKPIAFYNIENLFDIDNDPKTHDDDFLPSSPKRWTRKRYEKKLLKLGTVISKIGEEDEEIAPVGKRNIK